MLELYHALHSTCSQKARLCLFEKGLDWESRPVALEKGEQLSKEYLRLNPNGVVPTLVHDGQPIIESSVIVEYLDDVFPEPPLASRDPVAKARLRAWMRYFEEIPTSYIRFPSLHALYLDQVRGQNLAAFRQVNEQRPVRKFVFRKIGEAGFSDDDLTAALDGLRQTVERIDRAVAETGAWIVGSDFSLAEVVVTPSIDRMEDLGMADLWSDLPHFTDWWRRLKSRSSHLRTYPEGARLSDRSPRLREAAGRAFAEFLSRTGRPSLRGA